MKNSSFFSKLLFLFLIFSANAHAEDVFVICGTTTILAADDIKDVFIGEKQVEAGIKLTPIDNAALKSEFLEKVLHLPADKYSSIWVKKGFREGLNPPTVKSNDLEVIALVKSHSGTIGYVSKPSPDVKVIKKF